MENMRTHQTTKLDAPPKVREAVIFEPWIFLEESQRLSPSVRRINDEGKLIYDVPDGTSYHLTPRFCVVIDLDDDTTACSTVAGFEAYLQATEKSEEQA